MRAKVGHGAALTVSLYFAARLPVSTIRRGLSSGRVNCTTASPRPRLTGVW